MIGKDLADLNGNLKSHFHEDAPAYVEQVGGSKQHRPRNGGRYRSAGANFVVKSAIFFPLILMSIFPFCADDGLAPTGLESLPYDIARKTMLTTGSLPVPVRHHEEIDCFAAEDVCRAYPETERCAGTDDRPCIFRWRTRTGKVFLVFTTGELFADIKVSIIARPRAGDACFMNKC